MFQPISELNLDGWQGLADARAKLLLALGSELGTYQFGAESLPAIWVVANRDIDPPQHYTRSGLECLIYPPEIANSIPLHHNAIAVEVWRLRLIQHDRTASTTPGYYAILSAFPGCNRSSWFPADRDIHEQLNLSISFSFIVR